MAATDDTERIGGERAFLRLSECAAILGISTRQAYRWAERGRLPVVDLGGERGRFVPARALAALIAAESEAALEHLNHGRRDAALSESDAAA